MALIKCPECKKKISDTVSCCPKCGFSIAGYLSENRLSQDLEKNSGKKIKIFVVSVIVLLLALTSIFVYMNADTIWNDVSDEESSLYPLFKDSITTANNLLGKEITLILNGYAEGKDYTITSKGNESVYTFPFEAFELGTHPELVLYVDNSTYEITKVHYSYRMSQYDTNSFRSQVFRLRQELTGYYDADPAYTYLSNEKQIKTTKEDFDNINLKNRKTTYYITWENAKGKAVYSQTNLYEEKDEYGTLTFTKK